MNDRMLDALTLVGFMLTIANYNENLSQTDFQEVLNKVVNDMHNHLQEQDRKIEQILNLLESEADNK